jgi:hypothetical protein
MQKIWDFHSLPSSTCLMPNPDMEMKMSASPVTISSFAHVGEASETMTTTRSGLIRQGSLVLAATLALAAARTGGAGLDVPVQTVDHGCHTGQGVAVGEKGLVAVDGTQAEGRQPG